MEEIISVNDQFYIWPVHRWRMTAPVCSNTGKRSAYSTGTAISNRWVGARRAYFTRALGFFRVRKCFSTMTGPCC